MHSLTLIKLNLYNELFISFMANSKTKKNKKNISTTRSFAKNITELSDLKERVSTFASSCAEKLRAQNSVCNAMVVFIHTNGHRKELSQYSKNLVITMPYASNSDITLSKYATKALESIYKKGYAYKKAGVIVIGIVPENTVQQSLFYQEDPKHKTLMQTVDKVNRRFGGKKIKLASQNIQKTWLMRQERLSKKYTTDWSELLEVK